MSLPEALKALSHDADRIIETSCATVILKDDQAYKLKKSVDFGFLDFTTAEKRRQALLRELELNQRTAADIYRDVAEIEGESVLVMRRFETADVLDECSRQDGWVPDPEIMEAVGETIARFHAGASICRDETHLDNLEYVVNSNGANIAVFSDQLGPEAVAIYQDEILAAYAMHKQALRQRFDTGFVRLCHGDLHLGNILIEEGKPVLFDCIEFNERLSQIDVLYDLGFLLMDLWARGYRVAANRVMNAYVEAYARAAGEGGLYEGLSLLPLYMSVRAGVRCHVSANNGDLEKARFYLEAARLFLRPTPSQVMAVGGLSGSGKSTFARQHAAEKGRAPGALILRSDELRKRLWNWPQMEALPKVAYAADQSVRTYEHLLSLAKIASSTGQAVILDATFRETVWRDKAEAVAQAAGLPFEGIWLAVDRETRRQRVGNRTRDVSDATSDVAGAQEDVELSDISWQVRD